MATIKDVARIAGVSYTTVSHVVNSTRPVSPAVRMRVEAAIAQLGYVPSGVARSLRARSTSTIGLVVPNSTNPFFAELARGIEDECERNGYCVLLCNSDDNPVKQRNYLRVLQEKRIDGIIVASVGIDGALAEGLTGARVPVVTVDRSIEGLSTDLVQIDHEAGAWLATRHLLELGHTRIGCIAGPAITSVSTLRVDGMRRACAEAGVALPAEAVVASDFTSPGGYRAAQQLLDTLRPTAIFAGNDMMGIGALRAAAERGIAVPAELSVIGFDDIELTRYVYPTLSTVGSSIVRMGETAARTLLERIGGSAGVAPVRRVLSPELQVRDSTAAPRR
jgi:LacI family transcriptional regulator